MVQIDFNAVGQATNLKSPAARMRYTRLRRQIEGGTLFGTHGTPFAEKMPSEMRKRARAQPEVIEAGQPAVFAKASLPDHKIKSEPEDFSDWYETDSSEGDNFEDEMPLAKRRQDRVKLGNASSEGSSVAVPQPEFSSGLHEGQYNRPLESNTQLDISQSRPEIHENCQNVHQNSKPNPRLYTPEIHCFDGPAQLLEGNEDRRHT